MVFSELSRSLVTSRGRIGLLLPSGIATDKTTRRFFQDLITTKTLNALYDFVNRKKLFADVEGRMKFSVMLLRGTEDSSDVSDFVFWAEEVEDLRIKKRHIRLKATDFKLMNPNTLTCPIFKYSDDIKITRAVYGRVPVLIDKQRKSGGNPWGVRLTTMFHQTQDKKWLRDEKQLALKGFVQAGVEWRKGKERMLPVYEAKMTREYDHRASRIYPATGNRLMNYTSVPASTVDHQNPEYLAVGRYWADADEIARRAGETLKVGAIGFHDVARANDQRTMVACFTPYAGFTNTLPLIINNSAQSWRRFSCLLGNLKSLAYDFLTRQKSGGAHLNFFIVEQIPTLPPDTYDDLCPWAPKQTLEDWVAERVLKLTCTAEDMVPLAEAAGFAGRIHKWKEPERTRLRAELDAAYFKLYGLAWEEIDYLLTTFQGIAGEDRNAPDGVGETRRLIREAWSLIDG